LSTALITGASSGIGKAYAEKLASQGHDLILVSRKKDISRTADALKRKYRTDVKVQVLDISKPAGLHKLCGVAESEPEIEYLVHAAGFGTTGLITDLNAEILEDQIYLHDTGSTLLTRAVIPGMINRNKGRIILISSIAAFITTADFTVYSASKSFLNIFAQGLRVELAGTGVKALAVCPGLVKTEFWNNSYFKDSDYTKAPESFWLTPAQVVDESLKFIEKKKRPVMIAGSKNRAFINFLNFPVLGGLVKAAMTASEIKRIGAERKKGENNE
jgi:short-subunit dehydrogenase